MRPWLRVWLRHCLTFDLDVGLHCQGQTLVQQLISDQPGYRVWENSHDIAAEHPHRYVIVATQGSGDLNALELALSLTARHIGFVGSKRKIAHLREKLVSAGAEPSTVARIRSPAGTDIGAVTPREIALSILADIIQIRRSQINKRKSTS